MTEKQEHTVGPWKWLPAFGRVESDKRIIAFIAGGVSEAELSEALKNGSLIAAAPEMKLACEAALGELIGLHAYLTTCEPAVLLKNIDMLAYKMSDVRAKVEAALRKARGEK